MLYGGHLCQPGLNDDLRLRCAEKLMSRLTHLEQQVRDMLIFARGETRLAEQLSVVDFAKALAQAAETPTATRNVQLDWTLPKQCGHILCNRDALVGACMNLVNNSIEAGARHLHIAFELTGEQLQLRIHDDGPGFASDQRERLLEAFYTTKSHGTGLGLAVVQAVVQAHHGEFALESQAPGTVATLTLPLQALPKLARG